MFSHVTIGSNDVARAGAFYDGVCKALGLERLADYPSAIAYGPPGGRPQLWILHPADGRPANVGNGITVALEAPSRAAVDSAFGAGVEAGGKEEGAPGLRAHYHPNYYGAYLRDPDGHKICIVCHGSTPST
ncbi:VOC family protein [Reyranella sp.]|uniref:VOC family protein n=1 Tax=Reyranella sp. TaxID=1929291 RepID=UPI003BA8FF8E